MKVAHIHAGDLGSVSEGGIATYVRELIKNQLKEGMSSSLVGVAGDLSDRTGKWNMRKTNEMSFSFLPLFCVSSSSSTYRNGIPLNARFLLHLYLNKQKILRENSILHVHRIELAIPFLFLKKNIPIVVTIHGIGKFAELATTHALFGKKWFRHLYYAVEAFVIKRADKIILVSQEGMDHYVAEFPDQNDKFVVIPTSVDTNLFYPMDSTNLRLRHGIGPDEKILLFAGRFDHAKGLDLLIEAFRLLKTDMPKARLILAGDGSEKDKLMKKISELNISNVEFRGKIAHDALPEIMNCADVFVLTSLWEGMPLVVLEALACGIPVVSTDVGQVNELVKDGATGYLIRRCDPEKIKDKIILALAKAKEMKEKCIETAARFSSPIVVKRIEEIYKEVIAKNAYGK